MVGGGFLRPRRHRRTDVRSCSTAALAGGFCATERKGCICAQSGSTVQFSPAALYILYRPTRVTRRALGAPVVAPVQGDPAWGTTSGDGRCWNTHMEPHMELHSKGSV
jgi:hypothetical protein